MNTLSRRGGPYNQDLLPTTNQHPQQAYASGQDLSTRPVQEKPKKDKDDDEDDDEKDKKKKALKDLTQSWMDRLQLISMIATFFASTEAGMLQITTPQAGSDDFTPTGWDNATNAAFTGALAMHVNAAVVSFLASFYLIKYKVHSAKKEERKAEGQPNNPSSPGSQDSHQNEKKPQTRQTSSYDVVQYGAWGTGGKNSEPPIHLLGRCHTLCILLSFVGFLLMIIGIVAFTWARQPQSVSIFVSVCIGTSGLAAAGILWTKRFDSDLIPDDHDGK